MNKLSFLIPTMLLASVRAKCIICRTENSKMALPWWTRKKAVVMLETAMEGHIFEYKKREDATSTKVDLITTGRLMESKNVITAIRALAQVPKAYDYKYTIIGSGPMKKSILAAIERYELGDKVQIVEEIPREEVLNSLESADIYLFPSLREGGSWALMEAMAIGLPVVCLNWSGMAVTTDNESAVRLEVTNPNQMAKDMAETIIRLLEDSDRRKKMGEAGRKRIQEVFNWESKGRFMCKLLEKLDKQ
jgi:glycosyltransferase involved in cell wall biosynthesis